MDVKAAEQSRYRFGPFVADPAERSLLRDGLAVTLTHRLFATLLVFLRNPGRTLSKDELMEAIWPGRYVEESSLKQAISTLRKTLGGDSDDTQYILTVSGRGYTFTMAVEQIERVGGAQENHAARSASTATLAMASADIPQIATTRWHLFAKGSLGLVGVAALLAAGVVLVTWRSDVHAPAPRPKVVVLADFQNLTNDASLGVVLGKVLQIDLAQSPFLNLMSQQQVSQTLQLMERPKDAFLTAQLAQEVCARRQGDAMLSGAVARLGSHFLVTLEAKDCNQGTSIVSAKASTEREDDVPNAIDALTVRMREGMDEAAASIRQFGLPIAQATTPSFEALKAYSLGERLHIHGDNAGAIGFYKHAIELDSSFALAYAELANSYFGLRETEMGKTYYRKAFELKDRTSENEKLGISANYYARLGSYAQAVHAYQVWTQTYPQFWAPWANLANLQTNMGQYDGAIAAGREALRLNPEHYGPYTVLTRAYKRATQFAEAKAVGRLAVSKGFDSWDMHGLLYEIAYAERDTATMAQQVAKEKGQSTETWMLDYEALAAATSGQFKRCGALFERAIAMARAQGVDSREEVANFFEDYAGTAAVLESPQAARRIALGATSLEASEYEPFALAVSGNFEAAAASAEALGKRNPNSTEVQDVDIPLTRAVIDIGQGKPEHAVSALQPAIPFELRDFWTPYTFGQAYLDMHSPGLAAAEFRKILANRGVDAISPLFPLAYLGLGRALRMQGKNLESRAAYEQLFAFWKDADNDLPALRDAKREYATIPSKRLGATQDAN